VLTGIERQPRKKLEPSAERLFACCIAGAMRQSGPVKAHAELRLPSKLVAMAFGWHVG